MILLNTSIREAKPKCNEKQEASSFLFSAWDTTVINGFWNGIEIWSQTCRQINTDTEASSVRKLHHITLLPQSATPQSSMCGLSVSSNKTDLHHLWLLKNQIRHSFDATTSVNKESSTITAPYTNAGTNQASRYSDWIYTTFFADHSRAEHPFKNFRACDQWNMHHSTRDSSSPWQQLDNHRRWRLFLAKDYACFNLSEFSSASNAFRAIVSAVVFCLYSMFKILKCTV